MKSVIIIAALVIVASGCAKEGNEHPESDAASSRSTQTATPGGDMAGHGDGAAMSGGMMSEEIEKSMSSMTAMMVGSLGQGDTLYDHRFIDMMIPHHEGAIMMAKDARQKAVRPELLRLAESVVTGQQKEIDQMKAWRETWYGANTPSGMLKANEMMSHMSMMNDMMSRKLGQKDSAYEDRFIGMMIPHHEGAIRMAEDAKSKATHPEIKKLAQDIISAQNAEITQMKEWRKQWYGR